jgi:hypothetical protein
MPPVLKYGNKVKAPCILYLFPSWGYVFSNHRQYFVGGRGHLSAPVTYLMLHLKLQQLWPYLKQHGTSTNVKQHSQTDLNIGASTLYLEALLRPMYLSFNAFHFHSCTHKFPKIYTFWTWYFFSLYQSYLCLGSPCLPTANAKPSRFNTMPTALSKSCSEYQNIMTQLAYARQWKLLHILLYQSRNNQLNVQSQWPLPWKPTCKKFSQWCSPTFKVL